MEGLTRPLGLLVAHGGWGWWCALVRCAGVSLVCQLEPLERIMLSPEDTLPDVAASEAVGFTIHDRR